MRRWVWACALGWGCGTADPDRRLWPDRSDVLESARERARNREVVQATDPDPPPPRMGFAAWSADDTLAQTWSELGADRPSAPRAVWLASADADAWVDPPAPPPILTREAGAQATRAHLLADRIDCGRMPSDHFLIAVFAGIPLVAVAELPGLDDPGHTPVLLRAPGVPVQTPRELSGRTIGMVATEPFQRAAMQEWARRVGLSRRNNTLRSVSADTFPARGLPEGLDYLLVARSEAPPGTAQLEPVDISRTMTDAAVYQDLLVCARDRVADHRRDLVEALARWLARSPGAGPEPVDRAAIQSLSQLLLRAGVLRGDTSVKSFLDVLLVEEARARAVAP